MISNKELDLLNRYFNAANYLTVGQLYLLDNPLLDRKLELSDIKKKIVGHFGTTVGQNFIYEHLNRVIVKYDLNMIYISGPGHGGNAMIANTYLEGTYSEVYKDITQDKEGMKKLFKQFSFPGGVSSHCSPEVPGSINEGGELGYSLSHAYGAVLDNPDLIVACVVGDGEAETGPLSTSWHINKIINKKKDGVVLPILHLNGYKISNPTILSRISEVELVNLFKGYGYEPIIVEGNSLNVMQNNMANAMDYVINRIKEIKNSRDDNRPIYPMIILKTPKGWTGPKIVDGKMVENSFRSHQVPLLVDEDHPENIIPLESWLRSYHIEECFDNEGKLLEDIKEIIPKGNRRMGSNPNANGGLLLKDLNIPDFKEYMLDFDKPGTIKKQDTEEVSKFLRDIIDINGDFKIFCPDEAMSNRLYNVFDNNSRRFNGDILDTDEYISHDGDIIDSFLSEHVCEGMLEGYLLTGRHGLFASYEAFIRIVDSMVSQHSKWIKVCKELDFRKPISSLNILLTSHAWQQDHNGYTHQDPGFLNHIASKKSEIVRMYLPCDTNTLISTMDHCLKTKDYINTIVASKHPRYQWFNKEEAIKLCTDGLMIVPWLSDENPDLVLASSGETVATSFSKFSKKLLIDLSSSFEILLLMNNICLLSLNIAYIYIKYIRNKKLPFLVRIVKKCKIEF